MLEVITRLIVGGAQLTVSGICHGLSDQFDIHVVCGPDLGPEGSLLDELREVVPVTVLPNLRRDIHPLQDVRVLRALGQQYDILRPDIIHTHSSKAGIVGRLAARRFPRLVHTIHGWGHTPLDPVWRQRAFVAAERHVARKTAILVAISEDVRVEGLRLGIGVPGQYRLIPDRLEYRVRDEGFGLARRRAREALGLPSEVPVIGWVGRFAPQKDPVTLAGAVGRILRQSQSDVRAVFVGDGPLRASVERDLADVAGQTLFTGVRRDVRELYAAFDLLLHVGRWEGQPVPMVLQEAIAERVPVVATKVSGGEAFLERHGVGYVVSPGDVDAVVKRTNALLGESNLHAPLSLDAVARVVPPGGHQAMIDEYGQLYAQLLSQTHPLPSA